MRGIIDEGGLAPTREPMKEEDLKTEKRMAAFAETDEYKILCEHIDARIKFYQEYLPDGRPLASAPPKDLQYMWPAANVIIGELMLIKDSYEQAKEIINATRR